jgi:hypothetical protein
MSKVIEASGETARYIQNTARRWPRDIFDCIVSVPGRRASYLVAEPELSILKEPGVYILYRDDEPFYIGKSDGSLLSRLSVHANRHGGPYTYFWNYFSVFAIDDPLIRTIIESVLIAAIPKAANSAKPKLRRTPMPGKVVRLIRNGRERYLDLAGYPVTPEEVEEE